MLAVNFGAKKRSEEAAKAYHLHVKRAVCKEPGETIAQAIARHEQLGKNLLSQIPEGK